MDNTVAFIALIIALAAIGEGAVEYFLSPFAAAKPYLMYVSLAVGVVLAWGYQVDALNVLLGAQPAALPWLGVVLTGVLIGRGANYLHDFIRTYLPGSSHERTI